MVGSLFLIIPLPTLSSLEIGTLILLSMGLHMP
jgi:hypothetical protein